ncbi:uncharacterized protein perm1a [Misgurnus anguillicaudatus]|uniref:uncharacterized protein perm1a n=1 Tax=Misgurnus anguillicaudatus TaxID=75329 RepID=UPI003CCFC06C
MDDFDYSLHISDQDWDTFYQECEACNLLSPGLASREDSGMSDIDEMGCHLLDLTRLPASAEADLDGPPDCEGSPVDHYLSKYGIRSPEQVLSGSEEDLHLQTVNLFFEQLKSVTVNEQPLEQSHAANCQSEKMDHLAGLIDKQVIQSIGICPSGRNAASLKGEITKQGEADTWGSTALEKPIMATFTNAQARASDSTEREPAVGGGSLSSHLITVGMKQEQEKRCYHLSCTESTELKQKPETKPPDKPKMANWTNVTDSNPAGESIAQLNTGNISDSNDSPVCQFPVSPSNLRRKRRKKKRMSSEPGEPGHGYEAQFRVHQSESEEERFIQREVMNSLPTHFLKREHSSLPRVKMSSVSFNNENLPLCFNVASADLKCSKNLPLSFTNFGFDTKTQVGRTSMYNISKYTNDISLVNSGQLKAEVCQKSILPQMDTVLHIQENDVEVNQIQTDSAIQLKDTPSSPSIKETLSVSQSDKSATGCQRKSLLSPNISSAADSTEPLSSSVSLNLAVDACKDVSCMGNEIDCCAFKSEQSSPSKWKMTGTSDTQQSNLSMTENIDETESCLDGNSPKRFSQKGELVPPTDIQQINNSSEVLNMNSSLIKPGSLTEESESKVHSSGIEDVNLYHAVEEKSIGELSDKTTSSSEHMHGVKIPEHTSVSDHRKDEGHIQSIDYSSEISIVNTSLIQPENSTEESKGKRYNGVNEDANLYRAVEDKSIGKLCDETTSSNEQINVLKMPEDHVVSDHRNHEEHMQSINNSSEISIVNTSLIQPENSIEESEGKRYNSVNEDANLYHAVEEKIIGELSDKTTSSSEHINGLKIPEDPAVSDHGNDESHIQHINNHSEVLNMNSSYKKSGSLTEEPKGIGQSCVSEDASLYHAVEDKGIGKVCDETTRSSKHIDDLKRPEDIAVSNHGNDEGHIKKINNSSDALNMNSSLIKPGNLTEESECKGHNSGTEDANLYHVVEEKSISELSDKATSSSEHIHGLKIPEDHVVSDHRKDEEDIQCINNSSEISIVNTSLIQPENSTEESKGKRYSSVNEDANLYHAVEEKSIGELSDKTTSSSEHIHGLKIPEDHVVSDHRKDEEYMQNMNNSTEISIVNTSLIQPKNSTEESKGKRYNGVNEDANLYHVVEEKSIGELSDKTASSSEHIHGLKIPEHTSISDHEKDEGHLQSINNRSEILIANTSLIQPKNSTEESESKVHNSVNEDVNLYHAVEKNIGELNDKTISSGEHIHGLKIPEHTSISDHEKDEGQMQSINNSSEILIANTSLIQPENSTEESEEKRYNSVNEDAHLYRAVEDKSIGELSDETTRSSKHIDDLKRPEDIAVNDEGHIQHMNNSSEVLKMNSSLLKPGNLTEESEFKGHNSVKEDDNLYHAVEDRSIGELCDETTRSSEHIDDLKRPEHIAVSDHGNDEGHIQHINNSSDVLNINTAIIKLGNSTEDSEVKGQNSVSEEDKSIGELCNLTSTSSEHTCDHKKEIEMLSEDSTQNALADVSDSKSIDPESIVLNAPDQSPCPVYAISSFWNEMEKLTINDILRLRMIANAQHPSVLTQPEDGSIADATDAADSGYFTQPDDSKPDRLSEDMSFISDLDEDFTLQTPDCIKQEESSCELPSSPCSVTWQNDSDPAIVGDDVVFVNSETIVPEHLCKSDTQQCFRKICKNISVQNLQALESQPVRQMLRNASLHSIHSEVEDPFYHVNTSYTTCLSDDEEVDSGGISFSEIIQYFLGDNEPERCPSRADNAESNLEETCTSVPEMYDNFFSEFDSRSFLSPFEDESSGKDKMVPIFSCNRSGNHQFPEAYDYFFPDSPVHSDEDDENDNASIKVVTHKSTYPFEVESGEKDEVVPIFSCTRSRKHQFPEAYDYFFPDSPGHSDEDDENDNAPIKVVTHKSTNHYPVDTCEHSNPNQGSFFWTNLFSFRRVQRTGPSNLEEKSYSCALTPVKPLRKGIKSVTVMGPDDKPFPDTLYLNLENHIFQQLTEQQKKCLEMQTIIADPRLDAPFLPLRQADMCLVCIAFASWVLKSASPGADTWKAALLANISALSAIRYLRRHKREETSLRQIEPA